MCAAKDKITDWSLTLAQPTPKQRAFFNGFFGTPPEARLAILQRIARTNPPRFSLVSQGARPGAQSLSGPDRQIRLPT